MPRLTKNFSFIKDENIANIIQRIEEKYRTNDLFSIPSETRAVSEKILRDLYNFDGQLFQMIDQYKKTYGSPVVVDALYHIKQIGNDHVHLSKKIEQRKIDKVDALYLLKSLSILCQDAYLDTEVYEFSDEAYGVFSSTSKEEKNNEVKTIRENELKIAKTSIINWLKNSKFTISIPFYQRSYTWKESNLETLFVDVQNRMVDRFQHYFGVIAIRKHIGADDNITLKIIDGQQRITTTLILLRAAYDVLRDFNEEVPLVLKQIFEAPSISDKNSDEWKHIKERYINDSAKKGAKAEFTKVLQGMHYKQKGEWRYGQNYNFFVEKFHVEEIDVREFIEVFTSKFEIADLQYDVDPTREMDIFENMNSKGTELHEWDLIRNQIFNTVKAGNVTDLKKLELMESTFERDYADGLDKPEDNLKVFFTEYDHFLAIKKGEKYHDFERFPVYNNFKNLTATNAFTTLEEYEDFLIEIKKYSIIHKSIICNDMSSIDERFKFIQSRINNITSKSTLGFIIFVLFDKFAKWEREFWSIHNWGELEKCIVLLDTWLMRMEVVTGFGHSLRATLIKLADKLLSSNSLHKDMLTFLTYSDKDKKILPLIPSDNEFIEKMKLSSTFARKNDLATTMLLQLDLYIQDKSESSQFQINIKNPSLEHVMPRSIEYWSNYLKAQTGPRKFEEAHTNHVNLLGNFLVLPKKLNTSISNKPFDIKKDKLLTFKMPSIIGDETLNITPLADIDEWSLAFIVDRTETLAKLIAKYIYPIK